MDVVTMPDRYQSDAQPEVVYLATLQFSWGGFLDSKSADDLGHLVQGTHRGTPGDALCGLPRFARDADGKPTGPGWSVGGGSCWHGQEIPPCPGCVEVAKRDFPGLPVAGMREMSEPLARAIGTEAYGHSMDVPAKRAAYKAMVDRLDRERRGRRLPVLGEAD